LYFNGRGVNIEGKRPMKRKRKVNFSSQLQLYATVTSGLILFPSVEILGIGEPQGKEN